VTALRQALDEAPTLARLGAVTIRKLAEGAPQFGRMLLDRIGPTKVEPTNETREPLIVRWQNQGEELRLGGRARGGTVEPMFRGIWESGP
jgi:hypothetical protein